MKLDSNAPPSGHSTASADGVCVWSRLCQRRWRPDASATFRYSDPNSTGPPSEIDLAFCDIDQYPRQVSDCHANGQGDRIVEFETPEDARRAILELNDSELEGRPLQVREDREDRDLK